RHCFVGDFVKAPDKINGVQILTPAKTIWHPLPMLTAKVQIEHRRHRIHAQPIQVVLFEPKECTADQKITDFVTSKVKDLGAPVLMLSLSRVRVFIKMGSIKESQSMGITWEMGRNPVENDANPMLVT